MESIEQEGGRRRRRSYDEAFKRDAVRLASAEKYLFKAVNVCGGRSNRAIPSARISCITAIEADSTRATFRESLIAYGWFSLG